MLSEIKWSFLLATSLLLSACDISPRVVLEMQALPQINIDTQHKPLAVVVRAYLLTDKNTFKAANFLQLWHHPKEVLGSSLLAQKEWVQRPNYYQTIFFKQNRSAKYLAVVALFRNPKLGRWRLIRPLNYPDFSLLMPYQVLVKNNNLSWGEPT